MEELEKEVLKKLGEAWNAFLKLEEDHPSDRHEMLSGIHACQNIIYGRIGRRHSNPLKK